MELFSINNLIVGTVLTFISTYASSGFSQMTANQAAQNVQAANAARMQQIAYSRMNAPTTARVQKAPRGARQVAASGSASDMQSAMSGFAADMGRMPTQAEGLNALIVRPPGAVNWRGPYISTNNYKPTFSDPWGNQYRYIVTPAGSRNLYTIASNGRDGLPNTADDLTVQF